MARPKKTKTDKLLGFAGVFVLSFVGLWIAFFVFVNLTGLIKDDAVMSPVTLVILGVLSAWFAASTLPDPPSEEEVQRAAAMARARTAEANEKLAAKIAPNQPGAGPRKHEVGCWFCGGSPFFSEVSEYGWYELVVTETEDAKYRNHAYLRAGDIGLSFCRDCLLREHKARAEASKGLALFGLIYCAPVLLVCALVMDLGEPLGLGIPGYRGTWLYDFIGAGFMADMTIVNTILMFVMFAAGMGVAAALFVSVRGAFNRLRGQPPDRIAEDLAKEWKWDLAAEQLEAEHAHVDPHYIFHPDAPQVEYGKHNKDGVSCRYGKRERTEGDSVTYYWITLKDQNVEKWERHPVPRSRPRDPHSVMPRGR